MNKLVRSAVAFVALAVALSSIGIASANGKGAGGVTGPAFYVDGEMYRTVGTPTDFSHTGAPAHSFDTIYEFSGVQPNVAEAAPGQTGYNGGRWMVRLMEFNSSYANTVAAHDTNGSGDLDSNEEVESALADGGASGATADMVVKYFECPVIHIP